MLVNPYNLPEFVDWLHNQREIAYDTETTGLYPYLAIDPNRICGVSIGGHDERTFYLPFQHDEGYNLDRRVLRYLLDYLSERVRNHDLNLMTWNAKFDLHMSAVDGFEPARKGGIEDFMLGAHLLNENEPSFGLKEYCDKYGFGRGSLDERDLRKAIEDRYGEPTTATGWKGLLWKLPAELVAPYAETDATLTRLAGVAIRKALANVQLTALFSDINNYMLLIWRMERRGILIDRDAIIRQMKTLGPKRQEASDALFRKLYEVTESTLNPIPLPEPKIGKRGLPLKQKPRETFKPSSPDQIKYLTGWPVTDVKYIEELSPDDPWKDFGESLLDWRVLSKMSGTYYDAYLSLIDTTNTLRPNYNLHGTVNGRASCSKPNLQNVPRYAPRRPVKEVFIARPGYVLVEMDYQQAELRIATHYANEWRMKSVFAAGLDPHTETAKALGIPRFVAKTLNFLIIYGGGYRAIMRTLKCSEEVAKAYLSGYHSLYTQFRPLSNSCMHRADRDGYIRMETGRIRHFNTYKRYEWEKEPRKAMNSLIQGTAAEMLRIGMQRFDDMLFTSGADAFPLLQVHDSLVLEVNPRDLQPVVQMLHASMTDFDFDPAPSIEVKTGQSWAPMTEYQL